MAEPVIAVQPDIVKRLRAASGNLALAPGLCELLEEAAREVLTLREQRTRLGEALEAAVRGEQLRQMVERDREKAAAGGNLQLYCLECEKGAGDERQHQTGDLTNCPHCGHDQLGYSWDIWG